MNKLTAKIERCSGCKRCELACMAEHSDTGNYILATLSGPEPKTRIFVDSVSDRPIPVLCRHCTDALCVSACMAGCMQKDPETEVVSNEGYEQKCVGCWMCIMACPYGVISPSFDIVEMGRNDFAQAIKCDFCPRRDTPACVEVCPDYVLAVSEIAG